MNSKLTFRFDVAWTSWLLVHLRFFLALLLIFAWHRLFTFSYLSQGQSWSAFAREQAYFTGLGSDLWISWLLATLASLIALPLGPRGRPLWFLLFGALITVLLSAHQSYVEFFGFPMLPFHFTYFLDGAFLRANGSAMGINPRVWLMVGTGVLSLIGVFAIPEKTLRPKWLALPAFVLITGLCAAMHSANIHYRVQLMLPEGLRLNVVERLYEAMMEQTIPDAITNEEWTTLQQSLHRTTAFPVNKTDEVTHLQDLLLQPPSEVNWSPLGQSFQTYMDHAEKDAQPFHIMIVLMESMRAGDLDGSPSLTPHLDALIAGDSFSWTHAISTGNVTRGGQEASLCGHISSMTTSMMRKNPQLKLDCLPKLLASAEDPKKRAASYWLHGGEGDFDGQKVFWQNHDVSFTQSRQDFAANAPSNDWGMGDISFFLASWAHWQQWKSAQSVPNTFGMWLTVSNHPPWRLPPDAPEFIAKAAIMSAYPSYATTQYADEALGQWLALVKASKEWPRTLIFILGDHGQQESPPYHEETLEPHTQALLAHIPLILTGGLVETFAAQEPNFAAGKRRDEWVSQADIAVSVASWIGLKQGRFFGEPLLSERHAPVVSFSGDQVWLAQQGASHPPKYFLKEKDDVKPDEKPAVTYVRAFLRLLSRS